eukprot:6467112-Amphidinium_carterae.1
MPLGLDTRIERHLCLHTRNRGYPCPQQPRPDGLTQPVYDQLPCIRARDFPERPNCASQEAPGPKARWGHQTTVYFATGQQLWRSMSARARAT